MLNRKLKIALDEYVNIRRPTGGFLRACLENDFLGACQRADICNQFQLIEISEYIFTNVPIICYGNPKKVDAWLNKKDVDTESIISKQRKEHQDG